MPRAVAKKNTVSRAKKNKPLTLGELAAKIPQIKTNTLLYVALLISVFMSGYLYSRVQTLEKGGATTTATAQTPSTEQAAQPKISLAKVKDAFMKSKLKFGDTNKKLVVVEVADPSCPYCHIAGGHDPELNKQVGSQFTMKDDGGSYVAPVTEFKKLLDEGKIAFSYIYYPGHGNGEMGTKAMYCANESGKFWEVHNELMTNAGYNLLNNEIKNDKEKSQQLADFLSGVYDPSAMKSCLDSGKYDEQLKKDQALATDLQVQGTPGFYLNDTMFPGAYNFTDMADAIKKAGI